MPWTSFIIDLNREETVETFYQKKLQKKKKKIKKSLELKKLHKEKAINYVKWKGYNDSFNSWIDRKRKVYMSEYFPKFKYLGANVKVELDLSNYSTKVMLRSKILKIKYLILLT